MDEHLHKLSKYFEATTSKKQQRNEQLSNERSGSSSLKMGNQMHRNPSDIVHQKLEDRSKNVILNKRVRTSVAETRVCSLHIDSVYYCYWGFQQHYIF